MSERVMDINVLVSICDGHVDDMWVFLTDEELLNALHRLTNNRYAKYEGMKAYLIYAEERDKDKPDYEEGVTYHWVYDSLPISRVREALGDLGEE